VGFVFFVELIVPFLIFAPRRIRFLAARAIVVLQVLILLTGNYAFFNLLTISFCLFLIDDAFFRRVLPRKMVSRLSSATAYEKSRVWSRAVCGAFAALALFVGGFQVARTFGVRWSLADAAIRSVSPFQIINGYGLFAVMTITRPEIVIEGSNDGVTWLAYEFKYKAGDLTRRPAWVAPHQPRLDWQMWFAALGDYQSDPWIIRFMALRSRHALSVPLYQSGGEAKHGSLVEPGVEGSICTGCISEELVGFLKTRPAAM
jgi:hypothetical protein